VIGSGSTSAGGSLGVVLTGSAVFSSATSYQCNATYATSGAGTKALTVLHTDGANFTIKGDNSVAVQFVCVGN
jgi:hypothetical protein